MRYNIYIYIVRRKRVKNIDSHDTTTELSVHCGNINGCYWKVQYFLVQLRTAYFDRN